MLRGIYAAASGMITQRERLDVVANNLANIGTTGFKRARPVSRGFYQVFAREIGRSPSQRGSADIPGGGSALDETSDDFSPGSIIETGNPLDAAIEGPGFFVIRTPAGDRYTRDGGFTLSSDGRIVTKNGNPVLGEQGPIITGAGVVTISPSGDVMVDNVPAERIRVVNFPKPYKLSRYGHNLYGATDEIRRTATPVENPSIRAGALERSNVNPIEELVSLMDAERTYEAHQRIIVGLNESLDAAVNEIARA